MTREPMPIRQVVIVAWRVWCAHCGVDSIRSGARAHANTAYCNDQCKKAARKERMYVVEGLRDGASVERLAEELSISTDRVQWLHDRFKENRAISEARKR